MKSNIVLITSLFVLLIASRLITEIPNFTPTIALVMFTGYLIKNRYLAILVILSSQIISDLYIGIYSSENSPLPKRVKSGSGSTFPGNSSVTSYTSSAIRHWLQTCVQRPCTHAMLYSSLKVFKRSAICYQVQR